MSTAERGGLIFRRIRYNFASIGVGAHKYMCTIYLCNNMEVNFGGGFVNTKKGSRQHLIL
jgi:hypothetical protein